MSYGGGCLPFLGGSLDSVHRAHFTAEESLPNPPSMYLRQLYLDALVYYAPAFQTEYQHDGEQHLMFGTDHTFSTLNQKSTAQSSNRNWAMEKLIARSCIEMLSIISD